MSELRHYLTDLDMSADELATFLKDAALMKAEPQRYANALAGRILAMVFSKSSTRTRVSFEAGALQMGGHAIFLPNSATQMGRGEPISDTGHVLSRYVDLIMIRTYTHADVEALAAASRVPVINGLDDTYHPCQALADLLTISENKGDLRGKQLVYLGDGNNVAHSLMLAGVQAGLNVRIISPNSYSSNVRVVDKARLAAEKSGATVELSDDPQAVEGADVIYTDVWASMGDEAESAARLRDFADYQVNSAMMQRAKPDAIFLHCLPAHRGEEVSAAVIDGPQSRVFDQAENRLHTQKMLMLKLLGLESF